MRVASIALVVSAWAVAPLAAHEGSHAAPTGPSWWDLAALTLLGLAATLYAVGARRLAARGARVRRVERASFWAGWAVLVAALAPPMDDAAAAAFSAHMAQHELLMLIGAPLVIVGRPVVPWLWALPERWRLAAGIGLQRRHAGRVWNWLTAPAIAWALHGLVIWVWHVPSLYEAAVRSEGIHAVQHATFVGTAVLFWWGLAFGRYGRAGYGASVLYVFTTMVHTGVLGALFALSTSPFYAVYRDRAAASGIDAVADQQLAGLYMWIPAGIVLTASGLALLVAWLAESERRTAAARQAAPLLVVALAALLSGGCDRIPHEEDARRLTGGEPRRGRERIAAYGCGTCHEIPGVPGAGATVGPPLARIALRTYLAGHLENTPENMRRWIEHPQAFDAKTAMPEMGVTPEDSRDIAAYLYTLR